MITISLCMIVKDEEDVLSRCLECVKDIADEIIIVDTGSTDNTKNIVKEYTDKLYDFEWIDDFSAARNYSFSQATKDYILWLDADDVILEEDRIKLKQLKQDLNDNVDMVMMKYNAGFDENGNITLSYYRERLVKRANNYKWLEPIHEYIQTGGYIINSDICITHKKEHQTPSGRNISIYEKLLSKGKELSVRGLCYYAKELYYNQKYDDAIIYFNKFLDTEKGWAEDNISSCFYLSICYGYLNNNKSKLKILLQSFEYDTPRAEICCQLGSYYLEKADFDKAIFWYNLATQLKKPVDNWGFILHDFWDYIPNMQLCFCYDRIGNIEQAIKHNNKAAEYKPNHPAVLYNKFYFKSVNSESNENEV